MIKAQQRRPARSKRHTSDALVRREREPHRTHFDRLHESGPQPALVRWSALVLCHLIVGLVNLLATLLRRLRGGPSTRPATTGARVVLTGSFASDNWIEAHARPLAESAYCQHLWIVTDGRFVPIDKVSYVCPPAWLRRMIGRVPARSVLFFITALCCRANVVGGFHLLLNGLMALVLGRLLGARCVYYCVGGWVEILNGGIHTESRLFNMVSKPSPSLERALLRAVSQMDLVITMGTGARQFLRRSGVSAAVEVIPGGIDPTRFSHGNGTRTYDLITVSRMVPIKRLDILLQVVRRVADTLPRVKVMIVGDGPDLNSLKAQSSQLGLSDNVVFAGRQSRVERWLRDARLFVLTSDSEGLSLAVMEAMMAGLPCIVSDVGDLGDLVEDGRNGWRPPARDIDAFSERIVDLLTNTKRYRQFAAAARRAGGLNSLEGILVRWDELLCNWGFPRVERDIPAKWERSPLAWSRRDAWERTGRFLQHRAARALALVPPEIWLGRRFRTALEWVRRSDTWSRDEAAAWQLHKVRQIISLAYERSPYYRKVFRNIGFEPGDLKGLDDLLGLPLIDADTIREHLHSMCTKFPHPYNADVISTGGTGGRPLRFYIDRDRSPLEYAYLLASWQRAGYRLRMPLAVLRGRTVHDVEPGFYHAYDPLLRQHCYSTFHLNDENMARYLDHMRGLGPCFLHVYPSTAAALARFVLRSGINAPPNISGLIAESEIVYPEQRELVERVFGCRYFSCYGHTEKVVLASECEHSTHYHVWPGYGYCELVDQEGRPISLPGQRGEIVGTGFINTVVPFIRYRTGDFATFVADRCAACGRQHLLLEAVQGHRTQEVLVASDGALIPWTAINTHDATFSHVHQFQFYQDTPGRAVLNVGPGKGFSGDDQRRLEASLARKLNGRVHLTVRLCNDVRQTSAGKGIYVDQRIAVTPSATALADRERSGHD